MLSRSIGRVSLSRRRRARANPHVNGQYSNHIYVLRIKSEKFGRSQCLLHSNRRISLRLVAAGRGQERTFLVQRDNTANVQTVSFLFVVRGYNRNTDQLRVDWPSRGGDETTKWGQIECNKTANVQTVSFLCVVRRYNHNTDQLRVDWPSRGGDER